MISSAIWNKQARANFSKATKQQFTSAYLFQIAQEKSFESFSRDVTAF